MMLHLPLLASGLAVLAATSAGCCHRPLFLGCCSPCGGGAPAPTAAYSPPALPVGFSGPVGVPVGSGPAGDPGCATCGASPLASLVKPGYDAPPPGFAAGPVPVGYAPPGFGPAPIATTQPGPGSVFTGPPVSITPPSPAPAPKPAQ